MSLSVPSQVSCALDVPRNIVSSDTGSLPLCERVPACRLVTVLVFLLAQRTKVPKAGRTYSVQVVSRLINGSSVLSFLRSVKKALNCRILYSSEGYKGNLFPEALPFGYVWDLKIVD